MIFCSNCGAQNPDESKFCGNCGAPQDAQEATQSRLSRRSLLEGLGKARQHKAWKFAVLGASVLTALLVIILIASRNGEPPTPVGSFTATEYVRMWSDNVVKMKTQYAGNPVEITGVINKIENFDNKPAVNLTINGSRVDLTCIFPKRAANEIANLRKGQTVTIVGYAGDYNMDNIYKCSSVIVVDKGRQYDYDPAARLTARDYERAWKENSVGAEALYKGKLVEITGVVLKTDRRFSGDTPYVDLEVSGAYLTCDFAEKDIDQILTLTKGQTVTIIGYGKSQVTIERCTLIE